MAKRSGGQEGAKRGGVAASASAVSAAVMRRRCCEDLGWRCCIDERQGRDVMPEKIDRNIPPGLSATSANTLSSDRYGTGPQLGAIGAVRQQWLAVVERFHVQSRIHSVELPSVHVSLTLPQVQGPRCDRYSMPTQHVRLHHLQQLRTFWFLAEALNNEQPKVCPCSTVMSRSYILSSVKCVMGGFDTRLPTHQPLIHNRLRA